MDKRLDNSRYGRLLKVPSTWFVMVIIAMLIIYYGVMDPNHSKRIPLDDALPIPGISALQHGNPNPDEIALSYGEFKANNGKFIPHNLSYICGVEGQT